MSYNHLKFIDSLPCALCGGQSTHHHLLRVSREYLPKIKGTENLMYPKVKSKGMGTKSDDRFCLPLCHHHHAEAHAAGDDKRYFQKKGIEKPEELALKLWECCNNYDDAIYILRLNYWEIEKKCLELPSSKEQKKGKYLRGSLILDTY